VYIDVRSASMFAAADDSACWLHMTNSRDKYFRTCAPLAFAFDGSDAVVRASNRCSVRNRPMNAQFFFSATLVQRPQLEAKRLS
jgi:hypothetical protein